MILDTLSNAAAYHGVHPLLSQAFAWLAAYDPSMEDGRYPILDDAVVAIVQRYATAPSVEKKWETHRVHGDVQFMVEGSELIGYSPRDILAVKSPYDAVKDAEFYAPPATSSSLMELRAGSFAVFLPRDAHQPGIMINHPAPVHKVVVKFRL